MTFLFFLVEMDLIYVNQDASIIEVATLHLYQTILL